MPQTGKTSATPVRVSYLTEQTSHHPPVSAFWVDCPQKGIYARGFDQISAKFTGTSIKVSPGEHNLGIFITLEKRDNETYQLKHPAAHLGGLFRGSLSVTVGDTAYITCPDTKLKAILNYFDEGWLRGSTNKMEGIIFKYDPENDDKFKTKDVPEEDIVVRLGGPWKEKIQFTMGSKPFVSSRSSSAWLIFSLEDLITNVALQESHPPEARTTIIDIAPLSVAPKSLPPLDKQLDHESLKFWSGVTEAINSKQFSKATTIKQDLEEAQREKAREREKAGTEFKPVYFEQVTGNGGKPELTEKGREVLRRAQKGDWSMDGIVS